ncbi:hypothetical protein RHI9324_02856 [Rhizobium sp. CECT 9324]|jgi:hypothetical protein|nr:hypothetical protein RHI9324_02856 [Rhizobium sp. CECT 9324]
MECCLQRGNARYAQERQHERDPDSRTVEADLW